MTKEEILEQISKEDLLSIQEGIENAKETLALSKENFVQAETLIREEIAKISNSYKKDGTTLDLSIAPKALIKSALEVVVTDRNKLQEKLDLQNTFVEMMKNGNITKEIVDSYHGKLVAQKESADGVKDTVAELKSLYDSDIIEAVALIVDKQIKEQEEDNQDETKKPSKDKDKVLETVKGVLQIINERG